jgi:RNA polymerase sigma-70 factor (ECF subfamily)
MASARRAAIDDEEADDASLMAALACGDRGALAGLYDRHAPCVLALGLRMLGDRAAAEAVLEQVFLDAWHSVHVIEPGRIRAWLLGRMRSRALAARGADPVETAAPAPRLEAAPVDGLAPELAAVLELAYFDGLSCERIAERLAIPVATARARMALALRALRDGPPPAPGGAS